MMFLSRFGSRIALATALASGPGLFASHEASAGIIFLGDDGSLYKYDGDTTSFAEAIKAAGGASSKEQAAIYQKLIESAKEGAAPDQQVELLQKLMDSSKGTLSDEQSAIYQKLIESVKEGAAPDQQVELLQKLVDSSKGSLSDEQSAIYQKLIESAKEGAAPDQQVELLQKLMDSSKGTLSDEQSAIYQKLVESAKAGASPEEQAAIYQKLSDSVKGGDLSRDILIPISLLNDKFMATLDSWGIRPINDLGRLDAADASIAYTGVAEASDFQGSPETLNSLSIGSIPEPGSLGLVGIGLASLIAFNRARRNKKRA